MAANTEHHAFLRRDLVSQLTEHAVRVGLRDGVYDQPHRGKRVLRQHALELETRAAAALLAVGSSGVLSGATAAALYGCVAGADDPDIHVTVPYSRRVYSRPGLSVHNGRLGRRDVAVRADLPVAVLDLALADVLCTAPRRRAIACADQAIGLVADRRRADFRAAVSERLGRRADRRGTTRAEVLLNVATGLAESPPESWLLLLIADNGFPLPTAQHEVLDRLGQVIYRLDLAWPDVRIALEYDGFDAHEGKAADDAERDHRLGGRGWIVVRATKTDLSEPSSLLSQLRLAFAARGHR
jgi:hypothetical protein